MKRRSFVLSLTGLSLLTACGSPAPTPSPTPPMKTGVPGKFNETDVMFAQMMIVLQRNATALLKVAQARTANAEIKMLTAAVDVTQADESASLQGWLRQWDQPEQSTVDHNLHAAHGGLPSNGEAELAALNGATDAGFDKTFLNLFIGHQHQAVEVARMEVAGGLNAEALALAHRVDQSRRAQIEMMLKLVG